MPTGSFNVDVADQSTTLADVNAQIGTGSVDFLLSARHAVQVKNFGVSTSASYKLGLANSQQYKYGNRLSINSIAYYQIKTRHLSIAPNAGLTFENIESNRFNVQKIYLSDGLESGQFSTGGHVLNALAGAEITLNKITVGANVQLPLAQRFAAGQTKLMAQGMLHVTFEL